MQVENSFTVALPIETVWDRLLDVPSVAPCVPGAELTEVVSETEYKGTVTVKLGAVKVAYKGTVLLTDVDRDAHTVALRATGSETRGAGSASGVVTSRLTADGPDRTTVHLVSDVAVTGRVAQFGRNIIQDVSNRLIQDFARCLESSLDAGDVANELDATPADLGSASSTADASTSTVADADTESAPHSTGPGAGNPADTEASSSTPEPAKATEPGSAPAELKLLPIVVDVTRSRLSRGLSRLAKALDPNKESDSK